MESPTALNAVQEEYLIAALLFEKRNFRVPIAALAKHFGIHFCFARAAVNGLVKIGLLELSPHSGARLTVEGGVRARDIERRRTAIVEALSETLDLDMKTAEEAARNMRRALSRSDVNRIMCSRLRLRQSTLMDSVEPNSERRTIVSFPSSV
ncbi:metal-dependent transcriptional regulator [Desulfomonile tiedjei]|uniref:Uncharacterized protein n=1 Tax=Desulfomonile tiedjei (strain ATCC 49306 / DSM 6799 / DCB-1) TaxID=706587 RepID=I4C0D7_DESTA|nr:hypothetical protein [Desulfomonile tiedjei]AFM23028.1 hypothetical protein Desti_0287 [Desulfomonile tiedjei DSM 6799]